MQGYSRIYSFAADASLKSGLQTPKLLQEKSNAENAIIKP